MGAIRSYRLRLQRKRWRIRAFRKRRDLSVVADRTGNIRPDDILIFSTLRNEKIRLEYFLNYYRDMGVNHFLIVDNGSDDGSREYLQDQKDVSVWSTTKSYKRARFGVDWLNWRNSQAPPTFECYCQFYGESNLPFCACFFSFLSEFCGAGLISLNQWWDGSGCRP